MIIFGGFDTLSSEYQTSIHTFNLTSSTWGTIYSQSYLTPSGFTGSCSYFRSDRTVLIFFGKSKLGINSDIYSFNLNTYSCKIESLTGDPILGRTGASCAFFQSLDEEYIMIFGGLSGKGRTNDLYV